MASDLAWAIGAQIGSERAKERRERKQALSDEERQSKAQLYATQLTSLRDKISNFKEGTPEYNDTFNEIQNTLHGVRELYHPDTHPGLIESHGHLITDALGLTSPATNPGIKKEAAKRAQGTVGDERAARGIVAAGPLSPEQQGALKGKETAANDLAYFQASMKAYDQEHPEGSGPNATLEGKKARTEYSNNLLQKVQGKYTRPNIKMFTVSGATGAIPLDMNRPDTWPEGAVPYEKPTKPVRGGLVRTKAGQSPTGWVQTWLDPYNPNKVVGYSITTPSRYYQGTETSRITTDPYGVTSTSNARTVPTNTQETDISTFGKVPMLSDEGIEILSEQPSSNTNPAPPAAPQHNPPAAPHISALKDSSAAAPKVTPQEVKDKAVALQGEENMPTDDQGHIPSDAKVNPHLKEAANQLLDGVDIKELGIPTRDKAAAEALTYDKASGEAVIYCNGVIVAQATVGTFMPGTSYDFCLGARISPPDERSFFAGLMDEFSLYNRALSSNEIATIYKAGSAGKCFLLPPVVVIQPAILTVGVGFSATFSTVATGTSPLSYQWWHNESEVAGATNSTLSIGSAQSSDAGNYFVVVTNIFGSAISSNAALTVRVLPTLRIAQSNGQVTLAWPVWAHDFELQSSGDISLSPDGWAKVLATPQLNGGNLMVTLPGSETALFFRLQLP